MEVEIIWADNTKLNCLSDKGLFEFYVNFIPTEDYFINKLSTVRIITENEDITLHHCKIENISNYDSNTWSFEIRTISKNEIQTLQNKANIEYIAMMSGIDINK